MDGTGELFQPFVSALGDRIDTQVVSYPTNEPLDYAALEALVRERLPTNRRFVLLGESFSGPIAISIASNPPANLIGVVLCCTFASNPVAAFSPFKSMIPLLPIERVPGLVMSQALMGRDATPALRTALDSAMASVSPIVLRARAAAVLSIDYSHKIASIDRCLLYLRAARDLVVPRKCGDEIICRSRNAQFVEIEGPHFLLQTRALEAAVAIESFIGHADGRVAMSAAANT